MDWRRCRSLLQYVPTTGNQTTTGAGLNAIDFVQRIFRNGRDQGFAGSGCQSSILFPSES